MQICTNICKRIIQFYDKCHLNKNPRFTESGVSTDSKQPEQTPDSFPHLMFQASFAMGFNIDAITENARITTISMSESSVEIIFAE